MVTKVKRSNYVGNILSPKLGKQIAVFAKKGETAASAIRRVMKKHSN